MKIVHGYPPNIEKLKKHFDINKHVVFTYGEILYVPSGAKVPDDLIEHEKTHAVQQRIVGADEWWDRYIKNEDFRLQEELEAYQNQYKYAQENYNRTECRRSLAHTASTFGGGLYGFKIKKREAEKMISGA